MRLPTPARRKLLAAALVLAAPVVGFPLVRPSIERAVRARLDRQARALGLSDTIGTVHLTPGLSLEIGDVVVEKPGRVRILTHSVVVGPRLSPLGLVGRAAHVVTGRVLAELPGGVRLAFEPADWVVESRWRDRRIALQGGGEVLEITVARDRGALRVEARASAAQLSRRLHLLLHGCPVASLGTVDGAAQLERSAGGDVSVVVSTRARGLALVSLDEVEAACAGAALGAPTDAELQVEAVVTPAAGSLRAERVRVAAGGAEASLRLAVDGGLERPDVDLQLDVPRVDFARVLATAGLDLPAGDLGSATLLAHLSGPLLEPAALRVTQKLAFAPPARPLPFIERLKGPFVHTAWSPDGLAHEIRVSPEAPEFVPLAEVPPLFVRALLLGEDAGFYGHPGIDLSALPVALATNLARGTAARGGSTIAQQLAKNLFLSRRKTLSRKLEEASLALLLDASLGKSRELEIYMNVIEWGPGVYGLRPAARHYFDREPMELTPKQMAFLVSLVPGPIKYQRSFEGGVLTPFFEGLVATLLAKLRAVDALTEEEYAAALAGPLDLRADLWADAAPTEPVASPSATPPEAR
ncbi:MAG: transglycosylase domain-containing protein [Acidobacteria bacterium]|nr:transglycosylase domain-containing protein [Acidobacteriota bacterium]